MVIRKGRVVFTVMLTLVFCLTAVFPAAAAPVSAKDLVLKAVHNFDLGLDPAFYDKSEGKGTMKVTRFDGSVKEAAGDYTGATLDYTAAMDGTKDAMKMSLDLNAGDIARQGEFYMQADKLILSRDFFLLLQDFGVDLESVGLAAADIPAFVYWADPQFETTWEQVDDFREGKLPAQLTDLLAFFVEAVPEECFTLSPTKVTMKLDQDALTDTAVNLLTNVKNDSERVADMLLASNAATFEQMGLDTAEMKQEMVTGMQEMPLPSRAEVAMVMSAVQVNDFSLVYSLLPGGSKTFNLDLGFGVPGAMNGSLVFAVETKGTKANLNGNYRMAAFFDAADGPGLAATFDSKVHYKGLKAYSDSIIDVKAKDNATGELLLDLGLVDSNVTQVKPDLVLNVPALTAENSLDVTNIIPITGSALMADMPAPGEAVTVKVNGRTVDGAKMGEEGQFMVPARAALEPMGYIVHWVAPDTLRVLGETAEFTLVMEENEYLMGDVEKDLFAAPYLDEGTAMVPLGFLASEEIGAHVELD